ASALAASQHGQRHEGPAVAHTDCAHEHGEAGRRVQLLVDLPEHGECHGVDADAPVALIVDLVAAIDLAYDGRYRAAREVVAVDVQRDLLLGIVEGVDRRENAFARARVGEILPVLYRVDDVLTRRRRIGHPPAAIRPEQVRPLVVHDLYAFDGGIYLERLANLLLHAAPGVGLHTARRIDDEDDVLAVDGDAAHLVLVDRRPVVGEQALHLLREPLLRLRKPSLELARE